MKFLQRNPNIECPNWGGRQSKWASQTIMSHRHSGFTVNIKQSELAELAMRTTDCDICGRTLNWYNRGSGAKADSPTLDRTNNEKIMTMENSKIVCRFCNTSKGHLSSSDFYSYCASIAKRMGAS